MIRDRIKKLLRSAGVPLLLLAWMFVMVPARAVTVVGFAPGVAASPTGLTPSQITLLKSTGWNTMVLFSITIETNGNFYYGGGGGPNILLCTNGSYVGPINWGSLLSQCKSPPSSISRIEMSIGGWLDQSFLNIKNLIATNGSGPGSILYRNLAAMKTALGLDAMDYDDEYEYDSASAVAFGQICATLGLKVTFCPYTASTFWKSVKSGLGSTVDYVYLQCYAGGAGNDSASWSSLLSVPITQVLPGDWDSDSDTAYLSIMKTGAHEGCVGGWYWPSAANGKSSAATVQFYADLIYSAYGTNTYWQGGSSDYNAPGSWSASAIPGTNVVAVNDSGSNNAVQVDAGDPVWNLGSISAGDGTNSSGAFVQNGSTINATNYGGWLRLGNSPGSFGSFVLNTGSLNFSRNAIVIGESGSGTLTLNGTNISSGNILLGINSGSSGILNLNGSTISCLGINSGSGSSTVNLAGTVTFDCQDVEPVIAAAMGGAGGLTKNGTGTLTLTGRNTFTGPTIVNAGTLAVNTSANDGRLDSTASLTVNPGAAVLVVGNNSLFGFGNYPVPVTINAGGALTITSNSTAHIKGQVILNGGTLASTDTGSGSFGTWNLDQGTLMTSGGPATSVINAQNVLLATPTIFNVPAGATNGIDLNVPGYFSSGALTKSGAGLMLLTGTNTYTGGTTISVGTLQLGDGVSRNGVVTNNIVNNATLVFANPFDQTFSNSVSGSGALIKNGAGKLTLTQIHSYLGNTTIAGGTLALIGSAAINASAQIIISNGAFLDVNGRANQTLTLNSGKTIKGSGTLLGKLSASAGSIVSPGDAIGTLTVQNNITLSGTLLMELNRTNSPNSDRLVSTLGTIIPGGVLTVTNLGPVLQAGYIFHLFAAPISGFAGVNLPAPPPNCRWVNNLPVDGSIALAAISTIPTNITVQAASAALTLSWPADHTGWRLQSQTNGLGTNWFDVPNTTNVNEITIPTGSTNASIFFRLLYP